MKAESYWDEEPAQEGQLMVIIPWLLFDLKGDLQQPKSEARHNCDLFVESKLDV